MWEVSSRERMLVSLSVEVNHMVEACHCENTHRQWNGDLVLALDEIIELVHPVGGKDVAHHELCDVRVSTCECTIP